jgi:RNA polymerase sigma factor (sigma-70 family)
MATIITNYTTYDLRHYYADMKQLPRLSNEEERTLIASLAPPCSPSLPAQQLAQIRQRLIEGHLVLVTCIAIDLCPCSCPGLFADLVEEANLALVQATNHFDYVRDGDFTAYCAAWMSGKVKQAQREDHLLKVDVATRQKARQAGTLAELYALQRPISLDYLLDEDDPDSSLLEALAAPSPTATPPRDPRKRAQVDTLLSYLSPRAQTTLRLRYGLFDDDERPNTERKIASELGISRCMVHTTGHDAMQRLQALVAGEATIAKRNGRVCSSLPGYRTLRLSAECKHLLTQAHTRWKRRMPNSRRQARRPLAVHLPAWHRSLNPLRWTSYVLASRRNRARRSVG